ncbi:hypothetical protein [Qipengyuania sphaerica]|uniref:hypothetical protein n=1 Tax=Qipengyuania sphaerica TaxID=2867243 RepID=UPI001C877DCC|nr:hypothetical protein [Qipengyuania sphaerica]MBX7541414.1 hypothetical protein [Qipengyuania sphaerica]
MRNFLLLATAAGLALSHPLAAQDIAATPLTYADMVALGDAAPLVVRAKVKDQVALEAERAPGLAPGHVRLYVEAETQALIAGNVPVGQSLRYLVDMPLTAKGKVPKLKRSEVLLFARPVPGRPGEIQLVGEGAQQLYSPELEARFRPVLTSLVAPDAPPRVTRVADALAVEGTLVGESETQLFLDTENDGPVSITVVRRPNQPPSWGVSWTEIVDQSARPPQKGTLAWYRLACTLPAELPGEANLTRDSRARALAARDYAFVVEQLGPCERSL